MKIKNLILLLAAVLLFACQEGNKKAASEIEQEIANLKTVEEKHRYLEQILEDDQKVRGKKGSELMMQYGKDSDEYMNYIQAQWAQDEINLIKIEKYLEYYGHPKKSEVGDAALAPWAVIHHTLEYETRERNFEILYRAYLTDDLKESAFSLFLNRTYTIKTGQRMDIEGPFRFEDEFNLLIKEMGLEERKERVKLALTAN